MDDIFSSNDDDEVEFVIPNGIRVNSLNTIGKIRELLFENRRDSYFLLPKNYPHGQLSGF